MLHLLHEAVVTNGDVTIVRGVRRRRGRLGGGRNGCTFPRDTGTTSRSASRRGMLRTAAARCDATRSAARARVMRCDGLLGCATQSLSQLRRSSPLPYAAGCRYDSEPLRWLCCEHALNETLLQLVDSQSSPRRTSSATRWVLFFRRFLADVSSLRLPGPHNCRVVIHSPLVTLISEVIRK